jgi:hypothetical protein
MMRLLSLAGTRGPLRQAQHCVIFWLILNAVHYCAHGWKIEPMFGAKTGSSWTKPLAPATSTTRRSTTSTSTSTTSTMQDTPTTTLRDEEPEEWVVWKELTPPAKTRHELEQEILAEYGPDARFQAGQPPPRRWLWHGRLEDQTWGPNYHLASSSSLSSSWWAKRATHFQRRWNGKKPSTGQQQQQGDVDQLLPLPSLEIVEPHPLRTDTFELSIHWTGRRERRQRQGHFSKCMQVEFHPNGYCRSRSILVNDDNNEATTTSSVGRIPSGGGGSIRRGPPHHSSPKKLKRAITFGIGKWQVYPWGIMFTIHDNNQVNYRFYSDLHLNPFGKQPKFTHGLVLRDEEEELEPVATTPTSSLLIGGDRPSTTSFSYYNGEEEEEENDDFVLEQLIQQSEQQQQQQLHHRGSSSSNDNSKKSIPWFRPVVATFSGVGTGRDTADFSYKNRGFGLSSYSPLPNNELLLDDP